MYKKRNLPKKVSSKKELDFNVRSQSINHQQEGIYLERTIDSHKHVQDLKMNSVNDLGANRRDIAQ